MQRLAKDLSGPLRELDVTTLHLLILEHILGLTPDQQLSGESIRYSQDEEAVLQALEKEDFQAVFILNPAKATEILTIANGGEKMPQKSTYFYPKLISGLVVNKIDRKEEIQVLPMIMLRQKAPRSLNCSAQSLLSHGVMNWPSPGFPTIFPSSITVFPRTIVRIGTPLTFRPWYGVQPTLV